MGVEAEELEAETSIGDDIRAALGSMGANEDVEAPANDDAEPAPVEQAQGKEQADEKEQPAADKRPVARDESGKFTKAPKESKQPALKAAEATPAKVAAVPAASTPAVVPPAQPALKAPQSWTPAAREKWAALPPEIQAEIDRREREAATGIKTSSEKARAAEAYDQVAAPYRAMLGNTPPHQAFGALLQAQYVIQHGNPDQFARGIANIINQRRDVPVELISQYLGGTQPPAQGQASQTVDPNTIAQQVRQQLLTEMQQQKEQASQERTRRELEAFAEKHEFFEDVRGLMSALIQGGVAKDLEDAYNQAVKTHPNTAPVIRQREEAAQANAARASTQRTKNAASSVRSTPTSAIAAPKSGSLRDDLEDAVRKLSGS